jgi:hypothetical protein
VPWDCLSPGMCVAAYNVTSATGRWLCTLDCIKFDPNLTDAEVLCCATDYCNGNYTGTGTGAGTGWLGAASLLLVPPSPSPPALPCSGASLLPSVFVSLHGLFLL